MFPFKSTITWIDKRKNEQTLEPSEFQELCLRYAKYFQEIENEKICLIWEPSIEAYASFIGAMLAQKEPSFFSVPTFKLDENYYEKQIENLRKQNIEIFGSPNLSHIVGENTVNIDGLTAASMPSTYSGNFMQFSSGTTGLRKRIDYLGTDLVKHNKEYAEALSLNEKEHVVSWLPHYHDMGLIACFLMPLQLGFDITYMSNLTWVSKPSILADILVSKKGTLCWQPNFAYGLMTEKVPQQDLGKVRFITCAEPISENTCQAFESHFNTQVHGCYALAENIFSSTQSNDKSNHNGIRSSGKIFGSNDIKIENDEIVIKSDYIFDSYSSGEKAKRDTGWFYTGDVGYIEEGNLYVLGRQDDSFKINGEKMIPEIIELEVNHIEGVKPGRTACVPLRTEKNQTAILLYEGSIAPTDLFPHVRHLGINKCIQVEANWLVKSSSGKIARRQCLSKLYDSTSQNYM